MSFSGYQVETLLKAFHKRYVGKELDLSTEQVSISQEVLAEIRVKNPVVPVRLSEWVTPQNILSYVADATVVDLATEYQQQRRAGRFLDPAYIPPSPVLPIERLHNYLEAFRQSKEAQEALQKTSSSMVMEEKNDADEKDVSSHTEQIADENRSVVEEHL